MPAPVNCGVIQPTAWIIDTEVVSNNLVGTLETGRVTTILQTTYNGNNGIAIADSSDKGELVGRVRFAQSVLRIVVAREPSNAGSIVDVADAASVGNNPYNDFMTMGTLHFDQNLTISVAEPGP